MIKQTASQSSFLRILAACGLAIFVALNLRYLYLDNDGVRVLCDADAKQWFCQTRRTLSYVLRHPSVGWIIIACAALALVWPSILRLSLALVFASIGLVLFQADLASGAAALILLALVLRPKA